MNQSKKRNIIIGALCGVLLLMVVGYAAFSSVLNITGTSHIASNWDIKITNITEKNIVGSAATATNEDGTKKIIGIGTLNATFETNLVSPGDSIEYDITIKNGGNLNAKLDKITLSEQNNDMITFTASGLTEGEGLDAGASKVLTVKVEYKDIPEGQGQPSSTVGSLSVTLDFSQTEESITPSPTPFTGIVYSRNVLSRSDNISSNYIYPAELLGNIKGYTGNYESLNNVYFLKHIINNGQLESSEVCFIKEGLHCLRPNEFETSKSNLLNIFGEDVCFVSGSYVGCTIGSVTASANVNGNVNVSDDSVGCGISAANGAGCYEKA